MKRRPKAPDRRDHSKLGSEQQSAPLKSIGEPVFDMTEVDQGCCFVFFPYTPSERRNEGAPSSQDERATPSTNADADIVSNDDAQSAKRALAGDLRAALSLARIHRHGIRVQKNAALGYAWLLVGMYRGVDDPDHDAQRELFETWIEAQSDLSSDERTEAHRLHKLMCGSSPGSDANGPSS